MAKTKELPATIKLKIRIEVDRALYDRIAAYAKERNLPGTIESRLTENFLAWFTQWEEMFKAADVAEGKSLVGVNGQPLVVTPGGKA